MNNTRVIVFGSINIDLVAKVPRLPIPGETLLGNSFSTVPGGKGANQAVAVARLGIPTSMVGRVGKDNFGQELLQNLEKDHVQIDGIFVDESVNSGVAVIAVDERGENHIIVIPGANGNVDEEDLMRLTQQLPTATVLLLQLEIPITAVQKAAQAAKEFGVKVIFDPAPARTDLSSELYPLIDIITPNAVEAGQLVGFEVNNQETAQKAAAELQQRGVNTVIIKLGAQGVFCAAAEKFFIPAFSVQAVDTVAAGDAFNGGLAAALALGHSLREAVVWGAAAGAIAATMPGAQSSLPNRTSFDAFLQQHS